MMFDNPHFSRADVACDILDLPDDYVSQYRLVDAVSFRPYYGQNGALETTYWGARSSNDKFVCITRNWSKRRKNKFYLKRLKLGGGGTSVTKKQG